MHVPHWGRSVTVSRSVVAGRNFRFGYRAKGTVDDLLRLGEEEGMRVAIVDLVRRDGEATDETVSR